MPRYSSWSPCGTPTALPWSPASLSRSSAPRAASTTPDACSGHPSARAPPTLSRATPSSWGTAALGLARQRGADAVLPRGVRRHAAGPQLVHHQHPAPKEWNDADELVAEMIRSGCPRNDLTFGMMVHSLCQNGLVDRAMRVLDQMSKCGIVYNEIRCLERNVYNEIISCVAELGRVEEALDLFNSMPCKPDIFSYNAAIKGLCRGERWEDAGELITEMVRKDCPPR